MSGRDLFGALPDDLVQHVLSFLPSRDAVKSAMLARRWRHLWRSTPAVRVSGSGNGFRLFVNGLLLQREVSSPLLSFEIDADLLVGGEGYHEDEICEMEEDPREVDPHVDLWIRHAVWTCRARFLTARFEDESVMWFPQQGQPLFASPHLTTMHLHRVQLQYDLLDFSCCRALLNLTLSDCLLNGDALASPWLERLDIIGCHIPLNRNTYGPMGMRIATPRLRYLQLSDVYDYFSRVSDCTTPLSLENMPLLKSASIQLIGSTTIYDRRDDDAIADRSLLLHGLSEATSLELRASTDDGREILLRDLTWCPTFNKLKTLMLNEWCVYDDVTALSCIMPHTPRLENLILRLKFEKTHALGMKTEESHITSEHSCHAFEHLKTVEIKKCRRAYDIRIKEILNLLSDCGIPSSKISVHYKKSKDKKAHTKL